VFHTRILQTNIMDNSLMICMKVMKNFNSPSSILIFLSLGSNQAGVTSANL